MRSGKSRSRFSESDSRLEHQFFVAVLNGCSSRSSHELDVTVTSMASVQVANLLNVTAEVRNGVRDMVSDDRRA